MKMKMKKPKNLKELRGMAEESTTEDKDMGMEEMEKNSPMMRKKGSEIMRKMRKSNKLKNPME